MPRLILGSKMNSDITILTKNVIYTEYIHEYKFLIKTKQEN